MATKLYLSFPLKPSRTKVEFAGGESGAPPAGAIAAGRGNVVLLVVAVVVVCVELGGSTRIVDGTKS